MQPWVTICYTLCIILEIKNYINQKNYTYDINTEFKEGVPKMELEKRKRFIINVTYGGIITVLLYITVKYGFGLISPFLMAFIFAYLLHKPATFISKKTKLPYKPVALFLVLLFYCTAGILMVLLGTKVVTSLASFVSQLPTLYTTQIEPDLSAFFSRIELAVYKMDPDIVTSLNDMFSRLVESLGSLITNLSFKTVGALSGYATSVPVLFIKLLLMIISTFFIAGDYELLTGFLMRQFTGKGGQLLVRIKEYVVGTLFICIRSYALIMSITFIELSIGLSIIQIPNSIVIAFLIAIFDILPVLGTGGIMIPWVVISLAQGNFTQSIGLLVVYLAITVIRNIIEPKIVGSQIGLHPVVTLISMFVGAQLLGVVGLFGFPITLSLLRHLNDTGTIKLFK